MISERGISQGTLLTSVARHASLLLLSLVVRGVWCQLWAILASESLLGLYSRRFCSEAVFACDNPTCGTFLISFFNGSGFDFLCPWLISSLGGQRVLFGLRNPLLAPDYAKEGSPCVIASCGCRSKEISPSKGHEWFHVFIRDERTVRCAEALVKAHSIWLRRLENLVYRMHMAWWLTMTEVA